MPLDQDLKINADAAQALVNQMHEMCSGVANSAVLFALGWMLGEIADQPGSKLGVDEVMTIAREAALIAMEANKEENQEVH